MDRIEIRGAREHNLQNLSLTIPRDRMTVITGVSGSGKSSLAFDTLYAEGQRRYVESLSAYARQFLGQMEKPDVDQIEGLSPAISIEQRTAGHNPRSTVATTTEIYDYLRVLFARVGVQHCHRCGRKIRRQSIDEILARVLSEMDGKRIQVLAPIISGRKGEYRKELDALQRQGFLRVRIDGKLYRLEEEIRLAKNRRHTIEVVVDRIEVDRSRRRRIADSLETALGAGKGTASVVSDGGDEQVFSEESACPKCGISYPPLHPRNFSFNSPYGACPRCQGIGSLLEVDPELVIADPDLSIAEGAMPVFRRVESGWGASILRSLAKQYKFSLETPWKKLPKKVQHLMLFGSGKSEIEVSHVMRKGEVRWRSSFEGVIGNLSRRYRETHSEEIRTWIERFMSLRPCPDCGGARLRPESLAVRVGEKRIADWTQISVQRALETVQAMAPSERELEIARPIIKEIRDRLRFLTDVGLGYLTLDRASSTLSGGEAQRIRLATQIGSQLVGVLYILDEPSIGLHHRDNQRLLSTLERLRDLGNTVIVVEHDRDTMLAADHLIDLGPGAGRHGGRLVASGTPKEVTTHPKSLTGMYLSGRREIPMPERRRPSTGRSIEVIGARHNNLKEIDVAFPLGQLICVTGVSGSGKSSLVNEILYRAMARALHHSGAMPGPHRKIVGLAAVDKVINIDQSPIGRTPRSNAATYTGAFTEIRDLFAKLPESKARGYRPGRFSFNVKGGRCESCKGDGVVKIEMHFLPDVYVRCEVCSGRRYNRETLEVTYKGRSIADVLDLTVEEGLEIFENIPVLRRRLGALADVGLGYLHLGQAATTLSGGEAQRVKLATELSKVATGRTVYILDEPTTGLHFEDIRILLEVLGKLVDAGNTVIVIEHQLDVIRTADHLIDLGPEGGEEGGALVAVGTPEEVAGYPTSHTGQALSEVLATPSPPRESRRSVAGERSRKPKTLVGSRRRRRTDKSAS